MAKKPTKTKSKGGRPTAYKEEFCDLIIEVGKAGGSVVKMANACGVSKETIYDWARSKPLFSDAFTRARNLSQEWWEDLGQRSMIMEQGSGTFSQSAWSRSMAARFPEDWRESKHTEVTGADKGAIKVVAAEMSAEEAVRVYKDMIDGLGES